MIWGCSGNANKMDSRWELLRQLYLYPHSPVTGFCTPVPCVRTALSSFPHHAGRNYVCSIIKSVNKSCKHWIRVLFWFLFCWFFFFCYSFLQTHTLYLYQRIFRWPLISSPWHFFFFNSKHKYLDVNAFLTTVWQNHHTSAPEELLA